MPAARLTPPAASLPPLAEAQDNVAYNNNATIAGGLQNRANYHSFGRGGYDNAANGDDSVIGGGDYNDVDTNSNWAVIGGGYQNTILAYGGGTIGGGVFNTIQTNGNWSTISGGYQNTIQTNLGFATIGGGYLNTIQGFSSDSTVGGGYQNAIQGFASESTIGGGFANTIQTGSYASVIAGGEYNNIAAYAPGSFISSGTGNTIQFNSFNGVIGGGQSNTIQIAAQDSVIGGGYGNTILAPFSTISGGLDNTAGNSFAVVPGGFQNTAAGQNSFAAGTQAQATNNGSFVLTDDELTNFYSTASNQLSARFTGGIVFVTAGAGMTLDGQPILAGSNGTGLTNVNAATLNGLSSGAFAAASGSPNYIQNQNAGPQNASLNISGNATVSGAVTANALTVSNSFRVAGAGIGTSTAVFVQLSAAGNITGDSTYINNPLCNGDPNAILIITHNYDPGGTVNTVYNKTVGVWYNTSLLQWAIYNEDLTAMSANIAFNVLIIKH